MFWATSSSSMGFSSAVSTSVVGATGTGGATATFTCLFACLTCGCLFCLGCLFLLGLTALSSTTTLHASIFEVVELNCLGATGALTSDLAEYCRGTTCFHETDASASPGSNNEGGLVTCLPLLILQSEMERELVAAASQGSAESPEWRGRSPCWLGI
jgi:hypothetical protein